MELGKHIRGIYIIVDRWDRVYVGSSVNIASRWDSHRRDLTSRRHHNRRLQQAWLKHGPSRFTWKVLQIVAPEESLGAWEQYWMDLLRPHYNESLDANRPSQSPIARADRSDVTRRALLDRQIACDVQRVLEIEAKFETETRRLVRESPKRSKILAARVPVDVAAIITGSDRKAAVTKDVLCAFAELVSAIGSVDSALAAIRGLSKGTERAA